MSIHSMRRAFASRMISSGIISTVLAALTGHESSTITERHYIRLFNGQRTDEQWRQSRFGWVRQAEIDEGKLDELTSKEREELPTAQERENARLSRSEEREILKDGSDFPAGHEVRLGQRSGLPNHHQPWFAKI